MGPAFAAIPHLHYSYVLQLMSRVASRSVDMTSSKDYDLTSSKRYNTVITGSETGQRRLWYPVLATCLALFNTGAQ